MRRLTAAFRSSQSCCPTVAPGVETYDAQDKATIARCWCREQPRWLTNRKYGWLDFRMFARIWNGIFRSRHPRKQATREFLCIAMPAVIG